MDVVRIRSAVFIDEQGCMPADEWDSHDAPAARFSTCRHYLGEVDGKAVAVARWHPTERDGFPAAKLERFAVTKAARGAGYGKAMILRLIDDARGAGYDRLLVHAQAYLERLYTDFGFVRVGDAFNEAGIPHVKMVSTREP